MNPTHTIWTCTYDDQREGRIQLESDGSYSGRVFPIAPPAGFDIRSVPRTTASTLEDAQFLTNRLADAPTGTWVAAQTEAR